MTLHERADALSDLLHQASQILANGQVPNMAAFAKKIELLCKDINTAPPHEALTVKPLLADLIAGLDRLAGDLDRMQNGGEQ